MSIVVATLCAEGIAMAADSRCLIQREESDLSTGEVKTRFLDVVLSGEKIIVTDNNVAIGITGRDTIKGRRKTEEGRWETCQKPWLFELSTEERGKIRSFDRPMAVWKGEEDILLRLIGKEVTLREGRKKVANRPTNQTKIRQLTKQKYAKRPN